MVLICKNDFYSIIMATSESCFQNTVSDDCNACHIYSFYSTKHAFPCGKFSERKINTMMFHISASAPASYQKSLTNRGLKEAREPSSPDEWAPHTRTESVE